MSGQSGRRAALRWGVTALAFLLWFGVSDVAWADVRRALRAVDPRAAASALGAVGVGYWIHAARWRALAIAAGGRDVPSTGELFRVTLVASFYGLLVPLGGLGADAVQGYMTRGSFGQAAQSFSVVLAGRVYGVSGLFFVAGSALLLLPARVDGFGWPCIALGTIGFATLALWGRVLPLLLRVSPERLHAALRLSAPLAAPGRYGEVAFYSLFTQGVPAAASVLLVGGAGGALVGDVAGLVLLSQPAGLVPSAFGLGPGQVALAVVLGRAGVPEAQGMALALVWWATTTAWALPGAVLNALGRAQARPRGPDAAPPGT